MPAYEIKIIKFNKKTKKEARFSFKRIQKAIENDNKLRFIEKIDTHFDILEKEQFSYHAIEFFEYGSWELLCLYDIKSSNFYTFANIYLSNDFAKEKINKIGLELDATLIGEEGEFYEIEKWLFYKKSDFRTSV